MIACFDGTGLGEVCAPAHCPVLGIGQAAMHVAALLGRRFSIVTTLPVSVPVIESNVAAYGFGGACARVRPSGLAVLEVEAGGPAVLARLAREVDAAPREDGAEAVILGCTGMAPRRPALQAGRDVVLVDGVEAARGLAQAVATGWSGARAARARPRSASPVE